MRRVRHEQQYDVLRRILPCLHKLTLHQMIPIALPVTVIVIAASAIASTIAIAIAIGPCTTHYVYFRVKNEVS